MAQKVKLVCVGDAAVGKSCLFISYTTRSFPSGYVPIVLDNYCANVIIDGTPISLGLWDTAGQDYDRLRPLAYPNTDVFLICFSVDNRDSLDNVKEKWHPELINFDQTNVPIILVACKIDLRVGRMDDPIFVSKEEGQAMADRLGIKYCETSALTMDGVSSCMENAIRETFCSGKRKKKEASSVPDPPVMPPAGKSPWIEIETSIFADQFHNILKQPIHSDVTFLIDGGIQLNAHKVILCGASEFFSKVLGFTALGKTDQISNIQNGHSFTREDLNNGRVSGISSISETDLSNKPVHTTIELSADIQPATFIHVLQFLYTGVPHLADDPADEDLVELIRVSNIFNLPQLKTICTNVQTEQDILNPSIGTFLNDETGQNLKTAFFNKPQFADVIFELEGTNIYAHKCILCTRCDVMAAMFNGYFSESSSVICRIPIVGREVETFLAFLEYLYTDHSPIEESDSLGILSLADEYGQSRLINLCELYITKEVDKSCSKNIETAEIDVIGLLNFSDMHNATQLSNWSLHFISTNYEPFSKRHEWSALTGDNLSHVENERWPPVDYLNEVKVYEEKMQKRGQKCSVMKRCE